MTNDSSPIVSLSELLPCPFCEAVPHHGATKQQFDQLHGEPFQRYRYWCPKGHAVFESVNRELALLGWNTRASRPSEGEVEAVEDWVMAPREPTEAMMRAGADFHAEAMEAPDDPSQSPDEFAIIYRAMLAASPTPPAPVSAASLTDGGGVDEPAPKTRKYVILRKPPTEVEPIEAYGVYLNDGRFMCIAESNEADAVTQAENFYETGDYHIRPLYASPPAISESAGTSEALKWFVDRRFAIQAKFDLYGPQDTASAMKGAFACALAALAAPTLPASPEHGVKELEWEAKNPIRDNGDLKSDSVAGRYEVGLVGGRVMVILRLIHRGDAEDIDIGSFDDLETALAAAQADFAQRIRSCLTTPADSGSAEVTDEMVERVCGHLASWGNAEIEWFDHRDDIRAALTAALKNGRS